MRLALAALATFTLTSAAFAQPAKGPVWKEFKDWQIGCDNAGDCVALGFEPDAQRRSENYIRLAMKAGPGAKPEIAIHTASGNEERIDKAPPELAGKPLVEQFLAMAKKQETLDVGGKDRIAFSLAGLSATLLLIDEIQGRIGTVTALARPGDKPANAVPGPRPLPKVTPRATKAQKGGNDETLNALSRQVRPKLKDDCPRIEDRDGDGEIHTLAPGLSLAFLYCDGGAYNFNARFWLVRADNVTAAQALALPTWNGKTDSELTNPSYDPETGTLEAFGKGRGAGDCGIGSTWAWTGKAFVLASHRQLLMCNGVPDEEWPVLWRTRK